MPNLSAEVTLSYAGSDRLFALKGKQIEGLEHDLGGEGIGKIVMRVFSGVDYTFRHLRQTIYWGLIGGGMSSTEAMEVVKQYVDGCPIDPTNDPSSTYKTARAVLQAVHFGWEALPKPPGEARAPETPAPEQTLASTEPPSSAME